MNMEWKDMAGNHIQPGDYIVYAALWDRSATLKYGRVTRLAERKSAYTYTNQDRVPVPTIRVISVDRSSHWEDGKYLGVVWHVQKDGKEVALGELERMLVIDRHQVPKDVRELLDA
jgi:hypothetical protein